MKKFTFKGVLDGLRSGSSVSQQQRQEIVETLKSEHFQVAKTFRHGFPHQPTCLAFDPIQRLLALGTKNGSIRILGRAGVDCHVRHESDAAVLQMQFLVNEGALLTATADDAVHLWNFRQKRPELVHTLQFQRERITYIHLPLQSKWLYVGSERGNIHIVNIESFLLSGYVINWNKAIELSRKTHPGAVVHLSDNPLDSSKLLIAFECGLLVLWDLRMKTAEGRWQGPEGLRSASWHHEGKQFMTSHTDGSLATWTLRQFNKPVSLSQPHGKLNKDGKPEQCKSILKLEWKAARSGEMFVVFCGGLSHETGGRSPSITIMIQGKSTTVLEMEHNVVDFITLCESPYPSEIAEPYAVVVLLQNDLVVVDLATPGFPCFESPYPMDVHECAVTCCTYLADCPSDLIPAFYSVGARASSRRGGFSDRDWPLSGGEWTTTPASYNEIIITGHADGSIKFWDASAGTLQVLYKLKTNKIFERPAQKSGERADDDPFAVQLISLCPESRRLAVAAAAGYVILFKFKKLESTSEIHVMEVPLAYESYDDFECSPEGDYPNRSRADDFKNFLMESTVKVKPGPQKKPPGFQASFVCISPATITSLGINSSYGLMSYGTDMGLVIVDIVHRVCLLNMASPDLYGGADPYQRVPRSPKRTQAPETAISGDMSDRCRSPSIDQGIEAREDEMIWVEARSGRRSLAGAEESGLPSVTVDPPPRPTDLPLRPPRRTDRTRDTRLLSVPNIKYHHQGLNAFKRKMNKLDSSFSRSRSSSMSSLENISSEAIQCIAFADTYTKKSETTTSPTLWVGTSLGSVLTVMLNIPGSDIRTSHPVTVAPSGTMFRLKGCILTMSFLDYNGALIPYTFESWRDESKERRTPTRTNTNSRMSPPNSATEVGCDRQFAAIVSEKQAIVVALPSQNVVYRNQITEVDFVVKAEIISLKDSVCLVCYVSNGHAMAFSLPSLRPLIDVDFLPLADLRIARTFCFSNRGHGLFLGSPSEIQMFTVSSEFCASLTEMVGELFLPHDMPEPPKESFFKGLFGGGARSLDREELFGEANSGKASKAVAKHIPGALASLDGQSQKVCSEISRAHMLAVERGEKLSQLEERTAKMMSEAENFSTTAHSLMLKYKDKKWYQL